MKGCSLNALLDYIGTAISEGMKCRTTVLSDICLWDVNLHKPWPVVWGFLASGLRFLGQRLYAMEVLMCPCFC